MISYLKRLNIKYHIYELRRSPFLWLYGAILTIKYVDSWSVFPAITFKKNFKVYITKKKNSKLIIKNRLIFDPFIDSKSSTSISLDQNAKLIVENDFSLGNGIKVFVGANATLNLKGKDIESASGITADSVVMVDNFLEIGKDCIIAWNTFITDSDWHALPGSPITMETTIGDHVWIGVGAKILKGVNIGKNSIVTSNSVVLKGNYPESSMISGSPAKVIKNDITDWKR